MDTINALIHDGETIVGYVSMLLSDFQNAKKTKGFVKVYSEEFGHINIPYKNIIYTQQRDLNYGTN